MFCGRFLRRFFQKATAHPTRGALVASAEAKSLFRRISFAKLFFCACCVKRKADKRSLIACVERENPHLCVFPLSASPKFTLSWRFRTIREFRALRGATAELGGSAKPLKRLERNFQIGFAVATPRGQNAPCNILSSTAHALSRIILQF